MSSCPAACASRHRLTVTPVGRLLYMLADRFKVSMTFFDGCPARMNLKLDVVGASSGLLLVYSKVAMGRPSCTSASTCLRSDGRIQRFVIGVFEGGDGAAVLHVRQHLFAVGEVGIQALQSLHRMVCGAGIQPLHNRHRSEERR